MMENIYSEYFNMHVRHLAEGADPLELAAVLMVQALSMYKTALDEETYHKITDSIMSQRDAIKTFGMGYNLK
jgi:hypothetical protein